MASSTLHFVLPPETIVEEVYGLISLFTSYLSGDAEGLEPQLHLSSRLEEGALTDAIAANFQAAMSELISPPKSGSEKMVVNPEDDRLYDFIQGVSRGRVETFPSDLASANTGLYSDDERQQLASLLQAPVGGTVPMPIQVQIDSALAVDDLPSAVAAAVREVLRQLNAARDLMAVLNRRIIPITFVIMTLALVGIVWLHRNDLRQLLRSTGITLMAAGDGVLVIWLAAHQILLNGVEKRFASTSSPLPAALVLMLRDGLQTILKDVWDSIWKTALLLTS